MCTTAGGSQRPAPAWRRSRVPHEHLRTTRFRGPPRDGRHRARTGLPARRPAIVGYRANAGCPARFYRRGNFSCHETVTTSDLEEVLSNVDNVAGRTRINAERTNSRKTKNSNQIARRLK